MHIAFVTTESPYGEGGCGIAAYLRAIIPEVAQRGHRVTVFAHAPQEKSFSTEGDRVSVHHLRLPSWHWYAAKLPVLSNIAPLPLRQLEWSRAFYRRVARVAATKKIDVIEATEVGALYLHRIAPLVIRLHGSERLFREHSGLPLTASVRWNDALEARACNQAAAISAPSKSHANEVAKRRGWNPERVHVIPNPISEAVMNAAAAFHRNGHSQRIVLYAGRLAPVKGIETLLEAAKLVRANDPSISFVLAGPWQMAKSPEFYGLKNGANGIRWIGAQSQSQLIDWYKRACVLVSPSNYETFGLAAVEGMAFGLPVVATDAGALPEVIGHNDKAVMVSKRDPKALADGIVRALCSQPNKSAHQDGESGNAILEQYSVATVVTATLKLYEEVTTGR